MKKFLIMAGGTGGHVFPALEIAKELQKQKKNVLWLGTKGRLEEQIVEKNNLKIKYISVKGARKKGALSKILSIFFLLKSFWQSFRIIQNYKPDLIIGFGGYVSLPGGIIGRLLGKKLVIHEQNSKPGLSNKILSKISHKTLVAFKNVFANGVLVGNPIRKEFLEKIATKKTSQSKNENDINIFILGGSLGAKILNETIPKALKQINFLGNVTHQSGSLMQQEVKQSYEKANIKADVFEFKENIIDDFLKADLIIARSGALSVSEIAIANKAAIFVPLAFAVDNHQYFNAKILTNTKGALIIEEKDFTYKSLAAVLQGLELKKNALYLMGKKLEKVAITNSTEKFLNEVLNI